MSIFNTLITIQNKFNYPLFNPSSQILNGKLIGALPDTVAPDAELTPIEIAAENYDGSSGSITYDITIRGVTRQISINFVCNNVLQNSVTVGSPTPGLIRARTSSYSLTDHPLRVTVTLSAVQLPPLME